MVSETTPQVNIGNKYLSTKEAFDQGDQNDFVSEESFIPKECEAKTTRGDQTNANSFVVGFYNQKAVIRSQNKKARIVVENQQEPLIERRFTPLEEEQQQQQNLKVVRSRRGEECFEKVSQATLDQSYLQRRSKKRSRNAGKRTLTELKVDLNINCNLKVKRDPSNGVTKKANELHFWRLKLLTGKEICEAPFKRPLSWSYLALLLNLLLTVLAFSPLISSSSSPSSFPSHAFDLRAPEGAKLLISNSESRSFSRQQRQISPTSWTSWTPIQQQQYQLKHLQLNQQQQQQQQQHQISHQNVPYKTFYITRACEWKSNLFVPKSNDIHFAQPTANFSPPQPSSPSTTGGELNNQNQESSVVYETFNGNSYGSNKNSINNYNNNNVQQQQQQFPRATSSAAFNDGARTMLSTDSKALILALPIVMSQSFSGFESACSIRLIVPRNMRILAQLTSRRLTFAQQLNSDYNNQIIANPDQISAANNLNGDFQQQNPSSLWLNVSQNQYIETEHMSFETEGNVLAFRFLLERFANKQVPDTRFQVVLTAFQTLSDNSDLLDSGQLFICDQQRLISTNLACDGFKNCQDGHDESEAACATFRNQQQSTTFNQQAPGQPPNQIMSTEQPTGNDDEKRSIWVRVWNSAKESNTLAGFFIGFLLVLFLLTWCVCCLYAIYMGWIHFCRFRFANLVHRLRSGGRNRDRVGAIDGESDALAAQNSENLARFKQQQQQRQSMFGGRSELDHSSQQQQQSRQIPPRLQSILKKPGLHPRQPPPDPPTIPALIKKNEAQQDSPRLSSSSTSQQAAGMSRGALSSSLSKSQSQRPSIQTKSFRPTPARRVTRPPTRPVPIPGQASSSAQPQLDAQTNLPRSPINNDLTTTTTTNLRTTQPVGDQSGSGQYNVTTTTTGTQRITTYHYSSGSTRFSEQYLERLAAEQRQQREHQQQVAPQRGSNVNYTASSGRETTNVSPKQSSLI